MLQKLINLPAEVVQSVNTPGSDHSLCFKPFGSGNSAAARKARTIRSAGRAGIKPFLEP